MSKHRAKSAKAVMLTPRKLGEVTITQLRNAYALKPEMEYNVRTSVRQPERLKTYAELARMGKRKSSEIKSSGDNKLGNLVVPFKGGSASSYKYGSLTAANDIAEDTYVRGTVPNYKEIWGTMKFNARDLDEHGSVANQAAGVVSQQSFLKILPDTLDDFMEGMKEVVSVNLLTGSHFATLTADATANDGLIVVDHPERFHVDQKVIVDDDNSTPETGYVARDDGININTKTIKLVTTRGGATVVDFSLNNMTTAQNAKAYIDGAETSGNAFTSLKDQLLSAANGGSTNLFGVDKLDYPYTQAVNVDGSSITATNTLEKVFDGWTDVLKLGRQGATDAVMAYQHMANAMKQLDTQAGPFTHTRQPRADKFGWTEISVVGVRGELKLVGVQEMDFSEIFFIDWNALKLCSNGMFRMQRDPEGKLYFAVRNTTGYEYLVDSVFYGEQIVYRPNSMGVLYDVPDV